MIFFIFDDEFESVMIIVEFIKNVFYVILMLLVGCRQHNDNISISYSLVSLKYEPLNPASLNRQ